MIIPDDLGDTLLQCALRDQREASLRNRLAGRIGDAYFRARIDERVSIAEWQLDSDVLLVQAVRNEIWFLRDREKMSIVESLR